MIISKIFVASVLSAFLSLFGWNTLNNIQSPSVTPQQEVQQSASDIFYYDQSKMPTPSLTNTNVPDKAQGDTKKNNTVITDNNKTMTANANLGEIKIRAIVVNFDEAPEKFNQSKLNDVNSVLQHLNEYVKQSSYNQAQLQWETLGVYELGGGICNHASYNDKVNDLIQRSLQASDSQEPLDDYSFYFIVHGQPNCPDNIPWTIEGRGQFREYTVNSRIVHMRGIHISYLADEYLFHEFGHSLAYRPNTGIGHPDYFNCPITTSDIIKVIPLSDVCSHFYDWNNGQVPVFTIMSAKRAIMSDYNAPEKENVGWLRGSNIVATTSGTYSLSPLEQTGTGPKVLKIPVRGTNYTVYVSFRQPIGFTYPNTPTDRPNGVIFDIIRENSPSLESFLVTNNNNMDAPLQIGTSYRIGTDGPIVTLNNISSNRAYVTIFSKVANTEPASATIDQDSLGSTPGLITLTGTASNVIQPFRVSISKDGERKWESGNLLLRNGLDGDRWVSNVDQPLSAGSYQIQVLSNNVLLASGTLIITSPTPTCSLTANKKLYVIGETIIYSWTSHNATYASWQQDTSDKEHLLLPGDKLSANGSQMVNASMIGSPTVTLLVGGSIGTGSCNITVNVIPSPITLESVSFDQSTLKAVPNTAFTLSGSASAKSGSFTVAIIGPNYSGDTGWDTVGNIIKSDTGMYTGISKTISLSESGWSASFGGVVAEGPYVVLIYDSHNNLLGKEVLQVNL